jgi:uncharacterized membrane protein (DUF4010 family)
VTWDRGTGRKPDDAYDAYDANSSYDDDVERNGGRRRSGSPITATRVTLALALIGSLAYVAYAISVRDTRQIPLLASGAVVLGLVFSALAIAGGVATYHAGREGRLLRALLVAIAGGIAGLIAAGAFAFGLVLVLAYGS